MTMLATTNDRDHDTDYAAFLTALRRGFESGVGGDARLFTTAGAELFSIYLDSLPADRQVHNCSACRHFVEQFGGLVTIGQDGVASAALWRPEVVPEFYRPAVAALAAAVRRCAVSGVFLSRDAVWGTPRTGAWTHLAVDRPAHLAFRHQLLTPGQAMAAKREDHGTVARALEEFTADMLAEAMRLLQAEALARSERFVGPVKWLQDLQAARAATRNPMLRDNLLWRAVASAPDGYCHPRASVVGTLLEDIAAGLGFDEVKRRFDAKMHPLLYQRPQAAPDAGNIAQAEKIVAQMDIAPALSRRFARLDELETIWKPAPAEAGKPAADGVFGHLKPKGSTEPVTLDMPAVVMTWDKFVRTVLTGADALDLRVPVGRGNFMALTTAADAAALPILKWDREERRNPVAWYVYSGGSPPEQWGLSAGTWHRVSAVAPLPTLWGDQPSPHLGEGVVLVLDGAADRHEGQGNALFPECLRQELHAIRSTIEAYSRGQELGGRSDASACGYDVRKGGSINVVLRTRTAGRWTSYRIDRWD